MVYIKISKYIMIILEFICIITEFQLRIVRIRNTMVTLFLIVVNIYNNNELNQIIHINNEDEYDRDTRRHEPWLMESLKLQSIYEDGERIGIKEKNDILEEIERNKIEFNDKLEEIKPVLETNREKLIIFYIKHNDIEKIKGINAILKAYCTDKSSINYFKKLLMGKYGDIPDLLVR